MIEEEDENGEVGGKNETLEDQKGQSKQTMDCKVLISFFLYTIDEK